MHVQSNFAKKTRERYFSVIITKWNGTSRVLFATVNRLINPKASMPLELIYISKCNEFAHFFTNKVQGIKKAIISTTQITTLHPPKHLNTPVTNKTVKEVISGLSSSTCSHDELPTKFPKSVLTSLLPKLTHLFNVSLQTGTFPKAVKTAVIKPLLKKSSLDAISNQPFI